MGKPTVPFCVPCSSWLRCSKTGVEVEIPTPDGVAPLTVSGDEYECETCQTTVVVNFGEPYRDTATDGHQADGVWPDDIMGAPV